MKFLLLFLFIIPVALAQPDSQNQGKPAVPQLSHWANDLTNTLTPSEINDLDFRLKTYQDTTSNQIVMLMIPALNDYPVEYYSMDVAEKNKIGTKEHDNGALFLIVKNDRKMRIEVGYGLEGVLPDALCSSIIRNVVAPYFKRSDYYSGISAGISAMMSAIAGEYKADKRINDRDSRGKVSGIGTILFIIFVIVMSLLRGRGSRRGGFIFFPGGFGGGGFGSSGGFGGGGGFGGFSGGGGGFGGGGASGSW